MTLSAQYLAIRRAELDRLEKLRSQGADVPDWIYSETLSELRALEENERLRRVFFPLAL